MSKISLGYDDWIPIENGHLPSNGKKVLITYQTKHITERQVSTAVYHLDNWELPNGYRIPADNWGNFFNTDTKVLAWMELPRAY